MDTIKPLDLKCYVKRPKTWLVVIDMILLVGMIGLGAFIMVDGIISVIQSVGGQSNSNQW